MDAVDHLFEREDLADEPKSNKPGCLETDNDWLIHTNTVDQPESYGMVRTWREMFDEYSANEQITK